MRRHFYVFSAMLFVFVLSLGVCYGEENNKRPAKEVAQEVWNLIKNAKGDPKTIAGGKGTYWYDIWQYCVNAFAMVDQADDPEKVMKYFVDQFGKHGAQADMRWIFSGIMYTMPDWRYPPFGNQPEYVRGKQLKMAELITRRLLKDKEFMKRYHRAVLWHGDLFSKFMTRTINAAKKGLEKKDNEEYWWYARNLVLIIHAFGQDKLLKDVKPEEINKLIPPFIKWYEENRPYIEVDEKLQIWKVNEEAKKAGNVLNKSRLKTVPAIPSPETPFDDWGKDSPTPINKSGLNSTGDMMPNAKTP